MQQSCLPNVNYQLCQAQDLYFSDKHCIVLVFDKTVKLTVIIITVAFIALFHYDFSFILDRCSHDYKTHESKYQKYKTDPLVQEFFCNS